MSKLYKDIECEVCGGAFQVLPEGPCANCVYECLVDFIDQNLEDNEDLSDLQAISLAHCRQFLDARYTWLCRDLGVNGKNLRNVKQEDSDELSDPED